MKSKHPKSTCAGQIKPFEAKPSAQKLGAMAITKCCDAVGYTLHTRTHHAQAQKSKPPKWTAPCWCQSPLSPWGWIGDLHQAALWSRRWKGASRILYTSYFLLSSSYIMKPRLAKNMRFKNVRTRFFILSVPSAKNQSHFRVFIRFRIVTAFLETPSWKSMPWRCQSWIYKKKSYQLWLTPTRIVKLRRGF